MIEKYTISKDDKYYRAFTDLIEINGRLICSFSEMNKETKEYNICYCESYDKGESWSERKIIQSKLSDCGRWDCPRLCKIKDGNIIMLATWYLNGDKTKKNSYVYMWHFNEDFKLISGPIKTTINGIVPDKITQLDDRWITSTHENNNGKRETYLYTSYDKGNTWEKSLLARSDIYDVCETSIIALDDNTLVALMRENSHQGIDCLKTISYDKGKSWSDIYKMTIPACHRPIITKLKSGNYLITYRFDYAKFVGTGIHGNIFMGCICTKDDLLETNRDKIVPRIFPIDYDRNINSNCGYSSQVELDDGTIYVTSHIVDDNPVSQIRGYRFREKDLIIK